MYDPRSTIVTADWSATNRAVSPSAPMTCQQALRGTHCAVYMDIAFIDNGAFLRTITIGWPLQWHSFSNDQLGKQIPGLIYTMGSQSLSYQILCWLLCLKFIPSMSSTLSHFCGSHLSATVFVDDRKQTTSSLTIYQTNLLIGMFTACTKYPVRATALSLSTC